MAASIPIQTLQNPLLKKSLFLRKSRLSRIPPPQSSHIAIFTPYAKFELSEFMGGRGLCNGEAGLEKELQRTIQQDPSPASDQPQPTAPPSSLKIDDDESFEKELLGLTGGFPGGEMGLKKFIEENPPPKKPTERSRGGDEELKIVYQGSKPKAPDLPLFLPGMIVIVKNPNNPYHMYCGIVQRVTDGKAGVLFEGGNWDRLITFNLNELERREKGPPMVNPKSCVLESLVDKSASRNDVSL